MNAGWRIGSLLGIPFFIDPLWLFILALVTLEFGSGWQADYPQWGASLAWGAGFLMALLLFGSVLLHELGHSLVARSQGIKVNSITLFLFGGIAAIDEESKTPGQAFQVAIAGPAVSLTLFGLLSLLTFVLPNPQSPVQVVAENLALINLVLALFNLIPGLPLDGGQILKAAVWKATGSRFRGVHWAANAGKALGWLAILLGLTAALTGNFIGGIWISLLGWFGIRNASLYDRFTDLQEALVSLKAVDSMTREYRVIDADLSLRQFADEYMLADSHPPVYFAASDGRYRGMVSIEDLRNVERGQWETLTLHSLVHPLSEIPTVQEKTPLTEVINLLENQQLSRITVLSPAGAVAGLIDRGDIVRTVAIKMNLRVTEADIKRIKEEGTYPPGLQLPAVARTTIEAKVEPIEAR